MSDFNLIQQKTIQEYRETHKLGYVLSDDAVVERILADMEADGVIYKGFESLTTKKTSSSQVPNEKSLFGYGFGSEENPSFDISANNKNQEKSNNEYSRDEYNEAMEFAKAYLLNSSEAAYNTLIDYKKGIGYVSAGAVWYGLKKIANLFDITFGTNGVKTLNEAIEEAKNEKINAEKLSAIDKIQRGSFEFTFENLRGTEFDVGKVQAFKLKSDNYPYVLACKEQYETLENGILKLKGALIRQKQLERYGQNNIGSNKEEKTFDILLIEVLKEYCGEDEELYEALFSELSKDITSREDLENKFIAVLESLRDNAKKIYEEQLNGKSFEKYHEEYVKAYSEAFNGENPEDEVNAWIMSQEQCVQLIKIAGIIAATTLTGGSSLLSNAGTTLAKKFGPKVAQQIIKFGLTMEGTGAGVALDYSNALTSETGLTKERNAEILKNAIHSLPYAVFGAYVSGPFGDKLVNVLKGSNSALPKIMQTALSKSSAGVGFTGEVGMDIVFEAALNDTDFIEIIKGNVQGEAQGRALNRIMQMIAGGRAHGAAKVAMKNAGLDGYTIKPTNDGKYEVKGPDGKVYTASEADFAEIISKVFEKEVEANIHPKGMIEDDVLVRQATSENPADVVADKVKQQWGLGLKYDNKAEVEQTKAPLKPAETKGDNVTSLILTGKLKEALALRYEEMGNVFKEIAQKRSADFKKLAQECGTDKQAFADGVVAILAEEMDMKGLEPNIKLIDSKGGAYSYADWTSGTILINKNITSNAGLVEMISHEFTHMLQYRDILAQYGEQGLREVVMDNKALSADQKEVWIANILESDYTKKLLDNFNALQRSDVGSLNEYILRIYKKEFANQEDPNSNKQGYVDQVIEREAYNLGSGQLGDNVVGLDPLKDKFKMLKSRLYAGEEIPQSKIAESEMPTKSSSNSKVDEFGQILRENLPKGLSSENPNDESGLSKLGYEFSRNFNRAKRAVQYIEDKVVSSYQGSKKVVKGLSKLISYVSLDSKLKVLGIEESCYRETIINFLKKTPFESDKVYDELLKSVKIMKKLQIRDVDIQSVLFEISNKNKIFDQSSLDIITELSELHKKSSDNWDNKTAVHIIYKGKNNTELLEYIKEYSATLDAGYKFEDIECMLRCGIKGDNGRKAYEEILNSEFTQRTKVGSKVKYKARKYFEVCTDAEGKFSYEYWNILQNLDKANIKNPEDILGLLKNNDTEITRVNAETLIAKLNENPTEAYKYKPSIIEKCMTQDGKLDFSLWENAQAVTKLGSGFDDKLVKNKDGTYNQAAIIMVQNLQSYGFENADLVNILNAAKRHKAIIDGELYSQEIIQKAIELKNLGVKTRNIGAMLGDCIENGELNVELLENITPIIKDLDYYTLTEKEFLVPLLEHYNNEMQKQIVVQIQKLMQNGFSTHDICMSGIFTFKINLGAIVPENIIEAAVQLKQAGFSWNLKNILTQVRFDNGTLNTESLKFLLELKNKGISESHIDNVLEILTTEKGEFIKDNTETVLSLLKEYKDSEYCNSPKTEGHNENASDYISEQGKNIALVNILIKMSSDEAGNINQEVLKANKEKLAQLYNKLEQDEKDYFISYTRLAANKQGSFDENFFNKIYELKNLDDGWIDPYYNKTIRNFLDACKDENGNLDIQKYNDAINLVKKHGLSKHEASYKIDLYEKFKPYQNKNFVYDLSITEKRQFQSLLLLHSNNLKALSEIKKYVKSDIIPTSDIEYSMLMKQLSQSLGDLDFVYDKPTLENLHNDMIQLTEIISSKKPIEEVSVNMTYSDLLKEIKSKMSGLSASEKHKIYDHFGFAVKNDEIKGFPTCLGKNIESSDITDSFTKKVVKAVTLEIEKFNKNNRITVKDNPELSRVLTSISKLVPEVYNKFSFSEKSTQTLKSLKAIAEDPAFIKLNDSEKQVLIIATLLKDSKVGTARETAYYIYNVASKFNMSNKNRQNLYRLLTMPDLISNYHNTKIGEKEAFNIRFGSPTVEYDKKEVALDMLALEMKDNNLDELSYLLYSKSDDKLITPTLQSALKQRIFEIKSDDFILPQTHTNTIKSHLVTRTIMGYEVLVANASEIPNFYAYVHTPDAGAVNHSSRTTKFSNFEEFQNIDSDAVICTSYISADKTATWLANGFVFEITTGNEYVGMGHDMYSLGKNKKQVVAEYYRNKGLKALSGKGYKYSHRSFISSHLKDILHVTENSYSNLIASRRKLNDELEKLTLNTPEFTEIQTKIAIIDAEIQKINEDYVARTERVRMQIQSEQIDLDEIKAVDPELASAYEQFLARDNTGHKFGKQALMRNDYWNEVLVSNPKISAIYTKDINKLPKEYLEKAQNEKLPILIIGN